MIATMLECSLEETDSATIVHVMGEVDHSSAPILIRNLETSIARGKPIIVDLASATYVDSSALAALARAYIGAARWGIPLIISAPRRSRAHRVLEVSELGQMIAIRESLDEARRTVDQR